MVGKVIIQVISSRLLQTLEQTQNLSGVVRTGGVGILTHQLGPGGGANLGGQLELCQGQLAGRHSGLLAEHGDDDRLLGCPQGDILGVDLTDQLLGAV